MNSEKILHDCKQNKVKEGPILKQSRHIKQWKQRWLVLTKSHLYSFSTKGQYKDPTQCIHLKDIETFKSYFKDQYKKQYTFRVQSQQVKLHISAKSSEQKVAWMTAIQKTIERFLHPTNQTHDNAFAIIRETLKMAPALRQTLAIKQNNKKPDINNSDDIMKKMRLNIDSQTIFYQIIPFIMQEAINGKFENKEQKISSQIKNQEQIVLQKEQEQEQEQGQGQGQDQDQETFFILEKKPKKKPQKKAAKINKEEKRVQNNNNSDLKANSQIEIQKQKIQQQTEINLKTYSKNPQVESQKNQQIKNSSQLQSSEQKSIEQKTPFVRIEQKTSVVEETKVEQRVEQRVVYKTIQKIVKVPEIKEVFVQKIVYRDSETKDSKHLINVLKQLMGNPGENPTPLVNFVVYLLTSEDEKFHLQVIQFCLDSEVRRFFSQIFLLLVNQEIQQQNLNSYLKFILKLYEVCDDYFYSSDVKALITILLRQMEMNRSQLNQHLIMLVFECFAEKQWWNSLNYRVNEIKAYVEEIYSISGQQNRILCSRLLQKL